MKRLLWLLSLLVLLPLQVEAAVLWQSYSDPARTVQCDDFSASDAIVYMKGEGLQKNKTYRSTFWDAQGQNVCTVDGQSDNNGVYISQVKPSDYLTSSPGLWSAKLERVIGGGTQLIATDTFTVQASAIPEIPTVITSMTIIGLCSLIYNKIKRRVQWQPK